jgi:hypothetical protein
MPRLIEMLRVLVLNIWIFRLGLRYPYCFGSNHAFAFVFKGVIHAFWWG